MQCSLNSGYGVHRFAGTSTIDGSVKIHQRKHMSKHKGKHDKNRRATNMSNESKQTEQVKDTDAALTDKDPAATMLNPHPNFAKPDSTMGEDEGWNSDATGNTLGADQMTTTGAERRTETDQANTRPSWQSENMRGWQSGDSLRAEDQASSSNQPTGQVYQSGQQTSSQQTSQSNQQNRQNSQAGNRQNWQNSGTNGGNTMDQAKQTANSVADQAKRAASDVAGQAKQTTNDVVGQAKQAASETVSQAKQAVSQSLDQAKRQVQTTFDERKTQAAGRLGGLANALRQTGEQLNAQNEPQFGQYAQSAAEQIDNWSNMLQTKNLNELMNEVHDFAHRQPELFIAGSLAAGLLLGRFLKSSSSRASSYNNANRYSSGNTYASRNYDTGNYNRRGYKNSTEDATSRMDYESPSAQNITIANTEEENYAR